MMYFYIILAVILVLTAVIVTVPVRLTVDYANGSYQLHMKIIGLKFDLSRYVSRNKGGTGKKDKSKSLHQQDDDSDQKLMDKINSLYKLVVRIKNVYSAGRHFVSKHFCTENIYANISFGTWDAALTGMASGAIWALLYEILGLLTTVSTVRNHKFTVDSVYDRSFFDITAVAVFKFRIAGLAGILMCILYNFKKYKE